MRNTDPRQGYLMFEEHLVPWWIKSFLNCFVAIKFNYCIALLGCERKTDQCTQFREWQQWSRVSTELSMAVAQVLLSGASPGFFLMAAWEKKIKTMLNKQPALNVSQAREDVSKPRILSLYWQNIPSALLEPNSYTCKRPSCSAERVLPCQHFLSCI